MPPGAEEELVKSLNLESWLAQARQGSHEALGELLETCRRYLLLIANKNLPRDLQARLGASDLVQETLFEAQRDFERFGGSSREELLAWLRRILQHNLANAIEKQRDARKRTVSVEVPLAEAPLEDLLKVLTNPDPTPSTQARARETDAALEQALGQLSPQARQVILLRTYERRSYKEIGAHLGCSAEAARKIWVRAIDELRLLLGSDDGSE